MTTMSILSCFLFKKKMALVLHLEIIFGYIVIIILVIFSILIWLRVVIRKV